MAINSLQKKLITDLIVEGNIYAAIERLEEISFSENLKKESYLIKHDFNDLRKKIIAGILSYEEELINKNKIIYRLFELIKTTEYSEEIQLLFKQGKILIDLDREQESLSIWEDIIKAEPNIADAYIEKCKLLLGMDRVEELNPVIEHLRANFSESNEVLSVLSLYYLCKKDFEKSTYYIEKSINANKYSSFAWNVRGSIYYAINNYEKSITCHDEAISLNPNDYDLYLMRGYSKMALHYISEAILDFNKCIDLKPNKDAPYYVRSDCKYALGLFESSLEDINKAINLNAKNELYYLQRATMFYNIGEYQDSLKDFDRAIELNNNNSNAFNGRGMVFSQTNNFEKAIKDFDYAIQIDSEYKIAIFNRASAKEALGLNEDAKKDYNILVNLKPSSSEDFYLRGKSKISIGLFKSSIFDFEDGILLDKNDERLYIGIAQAREYLSEVSESMNYFYKAIEINPNNGFVA